MTAREILDKHFKDNLPSEWNGEMWDKRIIDAMEEYANQQLLLNGVVGRSEQFYCAEWNKVGYMCEEQCDKCKKVDNI